MDSQGTHGALEMGQSRSHRLLFNLQARQDHWIQRVDPEDPPLTLEVLKLNNISTGHKISCELPPASSLSEGHASGPSQTQHCDISGGEKAST